MGDMLPNSGRLNEQLPVAGFLEESLEPLDLLRRRLFLRDRRKGWARGGLAGLADSLCRSSSILLTEG